MLFLGIETSCDDTSVAFFRKGSLLKQLSASQVDVHALFGGVVPEVASREHSKYLTLLYDSLCLDLDIKSSDIGCISVTRGPGLLGSLLVGIGFAKSLSFGLNIPIVGVNHLHAHVLACGLENEILYPAIALLVSGGHTNIYLVNSPTSFKLLGKTLDDAAGEAFDKGGKMLGLPYPAGKFIDELSKDGRADSKMFPRPYCDNDNLDFSFSGLKTAMYNFLIKHKVPLVKWNLDKLELEFLNLEHKQLISDICASYSLAISDVLFKKVSSALSVHSNIKSLLLSGGVACNSGIRSSLQKLALSKNILFVAPSFEFCTDNAAMVAYAGYELFTANKLDLLNFSAIPRGHKFPDL